MGNSSPPERVHPIRDTVEVVIEQSGVRAKCHRRRGGMPEHPLHRLHVRPSRDREARRCMPQPMRRKPIEPRSDRRGVEMIATEVEVAEDAAGLPVNTSSSGALPAIYAAGSSARNAGPEVV
jgi:hypothetical protein